MVCLDSLHFYANLSWVKPFAFLSSKILFSTPTHPSLINKIANKGKEQIKQLWIFKRNEGKLLII